MSRSPSPFRHWTTTEHKILRDRYGIVGPSILAKELGRTEGAIRMRAYKLRKQECMPYVPPELRGNSKKRKQLLEQLSRK